MFNNFYQKKKILITGATGFKGAWLSLWLYLLKSKVYGIGFNPNRNRNLFYKLKLDKKIKLYNLDIKNYSGLQKLIKKINPEIVFHMAAQPLILEGYKKPYQTYVVNSIGTLNILDILRKSKNIRSIVCVTSDKCYQSNNSTKGFVESDKLGGEDPYSGSKASAEIIIKTYLKSFFNKKKCGLASARAGNVIGGGDWSKDRLIPDSIKALISNKTIVLRNPKFNRPWQHVLEPLSGYLILAKNLYQNPKKFSGPWNFGSEKNTVTDVLTIVKKIIGIWGKGRIKYNKTNKYYEQKNLQLNILKSKKYLNWNPKLSIMKSVEMTINWYKQILVEKKKPDKVTIQQILSFMNEK